VKEPCSSSRRTTSAYGVDVKYAASKWKDARSHAKVIDLASELGTLGAWVRCT